MRRFILAAILLVPLNAFAQENPPVASEDLPPPEAQAPEYNVIALQGLNKVTGHISRLEDIVGAVMRFGTLEIVARRCWKSPPEDQPENAALLEISELKQGEPPSRIFLGWMFSSSPGLSGLEHPVYDITVLSCGYAENPESKDTSKEEAKPRVTENPPPPPPEDAKNRPGEGAPPNQD